MTNKELAFALRERNFPVAYLYDKVWVSKRIARTNMLDVLNQLTGGKVRFKDCTYYWSLEVSDEPFIPHIIREQNDTLVVSPIVLISAMKYVRETTTSSMVYHKTEWNRHFYYHVGDKDSVNPTNDSGMVVRKETNRKLPMFNSFITEV